MAFMGTFTRQSNWWVFPWLVPDCHMESFRLSATPQRQLALNNLVPFGRGRRYTNDRDWIPICHCFLVVSI